MKPQQAIGAPITGEPIETVRQTPPENRNDRLAPTRRDLFRLLGAGLLIGVALPEAEGQESGGGRRRGGGGGVPQQINAWLHIAANGEVTAYTGKVDVGQNSRTALTQAVAEELRVPVASIRFVMGDTDLTPYDMGTFGSRTTPTMNPILRRAAAAAREQLLGMAAERWQVDRGQLTAAEGHITHTATQRRNAYGDLLQGQQLTQIIPTDIALTPAAQWRVLGTPVPKVDGRAFVTGQHRYASDMRREGMLFGRILRPVAYGAKLKSLDDGAARKMPGVTVVHDGDFVGVVAPTTHAADRALAALKAEWTTTPQPSDKDLYALLHPQTNSGEHENNGTGNQAVGNKTVGNGATVQGANGSGEHRLQATYTVAYIAHAPLEPRAAVAEWNAAGHLTVWTGTQRPFGVRGDLAAALGIPESRVRVIVPDTGSGYGGKHTGEAAIEAALLARVAGRPVRLVWTREEEFTWAYFRPAGVIDVAATVDANGALTAWEFTNYNSGGSAIESPYHISGQRCEFRPAPSPLRQGSYRGLAGTANHFARESHMDDLARSVNRDPLAFRLKNLKDDRLRAVLIAAADRFGWNGRKPAPGRGYGLACGTEKGGYIANCAEVQMDHATGKVRVTRVAAAFECGAVVNPLHLQNQVEGAIVMGLGGALFEAIHFENGRILNPHFAHYRVPRFSDIPSIEVVLLDRRDLPSAGAGETPIMAIAPAIGNAIRDATGVRLRAMPLAPGAPE